jgi:hypothetical protein
MIIWLVLGERRRGVQDRIERMGEGMDWLLAWGREVKRPRQSTRAHSPPTTWPAIPARRIVDSVASTSTRSQRLLFGDSFLLWSRARWCGRTSWLPGQVTTVYRVEPERHRAETSYCGSSRSLVRVKSRSPLMAEKEVKCVVVGDGAVGIVHPLPSRSPRPPFI